VVQLKGRGLDYPYGKPPMLRLPFMPDPIESLSVHNFLLSSIQNGNSTSR
jgi:hypothetical protein